MNKRNLIIGALSLLSISACSRSQTPDGIPGGGTGVPGAATADSSANVSQPGDNGSNAPPSLRYASVVSTPFELNLEQSALNSILLHGAVMKSLQGEIKQDLPDTTVGSPFAVQISGIHLDMKYAFNTPVLNPATQSWEFTTQSISAELTVDRVTAHEVINAGDDAASISIRIDGSCSPVHLTLPAGKSSATGKIQLSLVGNQPTLQLTSFTPSWTPGAWQVLAMNCQGGSGFGALVSQQASQMLSQINPYVAAIQQEIQTELASLVSGPIHFSMDVSSNTSVALTAQSFSSPNAPSPGPVKVQGQADFIFKKVPLGTSCAKAIANYDSTNEPSVKPADSGNWLSLPVEAVQAIIHCAYFDNALSTTFSSLDVPAFKSLVSSWIEDLLVWPDLINFKNTTIFDFNLSTSGPPTFTNARSIGTHQIALTASLPLELEVDAPKRREDAWIPYVRIHSPFAGEVQMTVAKGAAIIRTAKNAELNLGYTWDPHYVEAYDPDQRIWLEPIESAADNYLSSTGLSFKIPSLQVGSGLTLVPGSADIDHGNVDLTIELKNGD